MDGRAVRGAARDRPGGDVAAAGRGGRGNCTPTGRSRTGGALRSFPRLRLGQSPPDPDRPVGAPSIAVVGVRSRIRPCDALRGGRGGSWCGRRRRTSRRLVVEAVRGVLGGGRRAIVLVPEASPMPATTAALVEAFGERVCVFAGGDSRARYRTWLGIRDGAFDVVVGTRPAVFAPAHGCRARLGLARITPRASRGARALLPRPGCRDPPGAAGRRRCACSRRPVPRARPRRSRSPW